MCIRDRHNGAARHEGGDMNGRLALPRDAPFSVSSPDGTVFQATSDVFFLTRRATADRPLALSFSALKQEDIPTGTQVWLVNPDRPAGTGKLHRKFERIEKPADVQTIKPRSSGSGAPITGLPVNDNQ